LFLKIIEDNADQIFHEFASCVVSLDDYQELKIASAGVKIKVIGEIERISGTFSLKNVKLYFESDL
jgi:4-diphosphocytidyl-2C-methyl-D-erythritol kinase